MTNVVSASVGAADSVLVSPVVTSDVVTGPGGGGSGGWAELVSLKVTVSAPIAITALAPMLADNSLICFDFTSDHSVSVSGPPLRYSGSRDDQNANAYRADCSSEGSGAGPFIDGTAIVVAGVDGGVPAVLVTPVAIVEPSTVTGPRCS